LSCLQDLWSHHATFEYRQAATGLLLRQLVLRERNDDYRLILQTLLQNVQNLPRLVEYIHAWARGHFIPEAL
jgi:cellulose synthase operon protein C